MEIVVVRHSWPEKAGFDLQRIHGAPEYILVHFLTPAEFLLGDQWYDLGPGDLFIMTPHLPHRLISRQPLIHDWMHMTGDVGTELARFGLSTNTIYHVPQPDALTSRIARLESELFANDIHCEECTKLLLDELWIHIARQRRANAAQPLLPEIADQLRQLRSEMILHPEYDWNNSDIAKRLNISTSRLYPLYRRLFSISPGRDLILMRIEKAKHLLQQGYSVSQTSAMLGYGSMFHFIRQFKQITGMTPGMWAERN